VFECGDVGGHLVTGLAMDDEGDKVANPIRRTVMQRAVALPSPGSVWPLTTPVCHSANRGGSVA
jgi:hypothetical protein